MKYFDLINNECVRINNALDKEALVFYFINGSQNEISYGFNLGILSFIYSPERYEWGKVMVLKGLMVKLNKGEQIEYPVSEVLSFLQNDCQKINSSYSILSIAENLEEFYLFLELYPKYPKWEVEYKQYLKSIYPW